MGRTGTPDPADNETDPHPQGEQSSTAPVTAKITDDASVFEMVYPGKKIRLTEGGYGNIKITTKEDLEYAARMYEDIV